MHNDCQWLPNARAQCRQEGARLFATLNQSEHAPVYVAAALVVVVEDFVVVFLTGVVVVVTCVFVFWTPLGHRFASTLDPAACGGLRRHRIVLGAELFGRRISRQEKEIVVWKLIADGGCDHRDVEKVSQVQNGQKGDRNHSCLWMNEEE
jgi:hypothetical protein